MFLKVLTCTAVILDTVGVVYTSTKVYFIRLRENVINESYLLKCFRSDDKTSK